MAYNGNFPAARWKGRGITSRASREIEEELGIQADVGAEVFRLRHHYPDRYVEVVFFSLEGYAGRFGTACLRPLNGRRVPSFGGTTFWKRTASWSIAWPTDRLFNLVLRKQPEV